MASKLSSQARDFYFSLSALTIVKCKICFAAFYITIGITFIFSNVIEQNSMRKVKKADLTAEK
ncbi:hypothetical protein LH29_20615 [Draconibacterium sediminis]|uniref:Uncharacterized protein n=1 Tax=Draconibacterium sediminis TaxID=1544798 RepID=A0A0D8J5N9_9BACT|nr:hypothetical protein LH29_20615 [Draconibacterium sediminis]